MISRRFTESNLVTQSLRRTTEISGTRTPRNTKKSMHPGTAESRQQRKDRTQCAIKNRLLSMEMVMN